MPHSLHQSYGTCCSPPIPECRMPRKPYYIRNVCATCTSPLHAYYGRAGFTLNMKSRKLLSVIQPTVMSLPQTHPTNPSKKLHHIQQIKHMSFVYLPCSWGCPDGCQGMAGCVWNDREEVDGRRYLRSFGPDPLGKLQLARRGVWRLNICRSL